MTHCDHEPICKFYPSYCEERKQACPHGAGCRYDSRPNTSAFGAPRLLDPCAKPCCISPHGVITEQCRSNPCAAKLIWYKQQHDISVSNATLKLLANVVVEELVYDDGDCYYKVDSEKWFSVVSKIESNNEEPS